MESAPLFDIGLILTAVSVLVGVILGVIGFLENRKFQRRNLTVSLISNFMLNGDLSAADFFMTLRSTSPSVLPMAKCLTRSTII